MVSVPPEVHTCICGYREATKVTNGKENTPRGGEKFTVYTDMSNTEISSALSNVRKV